jgi:hypothetical protein
MLPIEPIDALEAVLSIIFYLLLEITWVEATN